MIPSLLLKKLSRLMRSSLSWKIELAFMQLSHSFSEQTGAVSTAQLRALRDAAILAC